MSSDTPTSTDIFTQDESKPIGSDLVLGYLYHAAVGRHQLLVGSVSGLEFELWTIDVREDASLNVSCATVDGGNVYTIDDSFQDEEFPDIFAFAEFIPDSAYSIGYNDFIVLVQEI